VRDVGPPIDTGDEQGPPDAVPFSTALAETGIDEPTYRRFRAALLSTGYLEVEVAPGYKDEAIRLSANSPPRTRCSPHSALTR
jgi:hypothetical protein